MYTMLDYWLVVNRGRLCTPNHMCFKVFFGIYISVAPQPYSLSFWDLVSFDIV